ncbi:hypothetical protein TNCV_1010781 [Trichonephila clavipes]|uniref:Uncharacterized protein n=1 Tax=Trichonephila clavipes TaxID=2585209 RepID=A0A8X6VX51_TRICX|nr:hypothetical protein TNCV_1010781 [Trichonephila clavipes]
MDAISRRYRKPKGRPSKRSRVCVHPKYKRDAEKNHMQSDSDSTMCAKNSDILLAENSLIMDTEISISDEGSHAGEKEQYLNASLSKLQMFSLQHQLLYYIAQNALPQKGIMEKIVLSTPYGTNPTKKNAAKNYVGSSNAMEVKAAENSMEKIH